MASAWKMLNHRPCGALSLIDALSAILGAHSHPLLSGNLDICAATTMQFGDGFADQFGATGGSLVGRLIEHAMRRAPS
jgi:hypothetical protein